VEKTTYEKLVKLLNYWVEIQWILYLPPLAQKETAVRLRLFLLTFLYLHLCKELFPDIEPPQRVREYFMETIAETATPPTGLTRPMIKEWVAKLCIKLGGLKTNSQSFRKKYCPPNSSFGKLKKQEFWNLFIQLRKESRKQTRLIPDELTCAVSLERRHVQTIMNLYLHSLVAHCAVMFECTDFRSTNTERAEAHIAKQKKTLLNNTNRNLQTAQPTRELILRGVGEASVVREGLKKSSITQTTGRIKKAFASHVFEEIEIKTADFDKDYIDALLEKVMAYGEVQVEGGTVKSKTAQSCQHLLGKFGYGCTF